jgi:hypothetical protein
MSDDPRRKTRSMTPAGGAGARASSSSSSEKRKTRRTARKTTAKKTKPLGTKIPFEELTPGVRYLAKYIGKPFLKSDPGWLLAGEFIDSGVVAYAPSGKPYILMKAVEEVDGYLQPDSAYKVNERDGKLFDLVLMPRGGYLSRKHPEREVYLPSAKWEFYPDSRYSMKQLTEMVPRLATLPESLLSRIAVMSQPRLIEKTVKKG